MGKYRMQILSCLQQSGGHMTAEQIFLWVKRREPGIVLATVYNNLNRLCQEGVIRRISIPGQPDRYDKTAAPHDHLICDRCGQLADVVFPDFLRELETKLHIHLNSYELNIHYICPDCQQKAAAGAREELL